MITELGGGHPPNNLEDDGELAAATQIGIPSTEDLELTPWQLIWVRSPGELRVYDSQKRVTGLVKEIIKEEIPNSIYDQENEIIALFASYDTYRYEVVGIDEETYGLDIASIEGGEATTFTATNIPTTSEEIHQYIVDWDALSLGEEGVTVQIDADGNGFFEGFVSSDNELTYDEVMLQTPITIDFDPDTLNLKSKGKWVTVYIELPEGYFLEDIDIEKIAIPYEEGNVPAEWGEVQEDVLMVKFDRCKVVDMLDQGDEVELTVTGELPDGTPFEGSDTIRVLEKK